MDKKVVKKYKYNKINNISISNNGRNWYGWVHKMAILFVSPLNFACKSFSIFVS